MTITSFMFVSLQLTTLKINDKIMKKKIYFRNIVMLFKTRFKKRIEHLEDKKIA